MKKFLILTAFTFVCTSCRTVDKSITQSESLSEQSKLEEIKTDSSQLIELVSSDTISSFLQHQTSELVVELRNPNDSIVVVESVVIDQNGKPKKRRVFSGTGTVTDRHTSGKALTAQRTERASAEHNKKVESTAEAVTSKQQQASASKNVNRDWPSVFTIVGILWLSALAIAGFLWLKRRHNDSEV